MCILDAFQLNFSTNESTYFMVNQMYMIHNSIYIILLYICICVCIRNEQPKALIETGACRTLDLIFQTRHAAKRREPQAHPPLSLFFRPSHPFCRLTFSSSSLSFFLFNMMLIMQQAKKQKENHGTRDSHVVPHRGTNRALFSLTSWIGRGRVLYEGYGRG